MVLRNNLIIVWYVSFINIHVGFVIRDLRAINDFLLKMCNFYVVVYNVINNRHFLFLNIM